jgi:hypothetical protein
MTTAELFREVMMILWNGDLLASTEARAIASYIKNHRVNAENAFEVQAIMWDKPVRLVKDAETAMSDYPVPRTDYPEDSHHIVLFDDESQVIITARNGIGSGIEVVA